MRSFVVEPTPEYKNAVDTLKGLHFSLRGRAYAQAVYDETMAAYIKRHDLKPTTGRQCVCRLISKDGRCHCGGSMIVPGRDHSSLWLKDGKPFVYVTQPYFMNHKTIKQLLDFCEANGLTLSISADHGWHFPGATLFIEIKRREA